MAKLKRYSLGHKYKEEAVSSSPSTNYPSFYLTDKTLPLKESDVGKTITVVADIKLISLSNSVNSGGKDVSYQFDVVNLTL